MYLILNFVLSSFNQLNILWCCDISQFRNNVLCAIVIWWKILTFSLLWPIIKAETCCTLYNKYFPITVLTDVFSNPVISFADHNSLSHPQITNSLVSYVLSIQVQTSLTDPSHSRFTNHSVTLCCTAETDDKRHYPLRTVRPIYRTGVPLPSKCCILHILFQQI